VADIPLLDEAAECWARRLGGPGAAPRRGAPAQEEEDYAQGVLELTGLAGQGLVDAAMIAAGTATRGRTSRPPNGPRDRAWAYGTYRR